LCAAAPPILGVPHVNITDLATQVNVLLNALFNVLFKVLRPSSGAFAVAAVESRGGVSYKRCIV